MGFKISGNSITFTPDSNDKKKEYKPLPEGTYAVAITEAEAESDEKGDRLAIRYTVDDESNNYNRRVLFDTIYLVGRSVSPKAVEMGHRKYAALASLAGIDLDDDIDSDVFCSNLIGVTGYAEVTQREFQGKTFNNIKSVTAKPSKVKKVTTKGGF